MHFEHSLPFLSPRQKALDQVTLAVQHRLSGVMKTGFCFQKILFGYFICTAINLEIT